MKPKGNVFRLLILQIIINEKSNHIFVWFVDIFLINTLNYQSI